jgi:CHAT domain-containing protein
VEYAALPDRLIIWVVSRRKFRAVQQKIGADELRREIESFRQLVGRAPTAKAPDYQPAARRLYEMLIAPVAATLERRKLLCLAPDGPLYELPFAALLRPDNGASLLDEYTLTLSPGASLFVLCAESGSRLAGGPERLLAVGNPSFDRSKYPRLPELPDAEKEVAAIAALYPQAPALTRRQATKARVISEMSRANVIHLAAHSEVDQRSPMRTKIILAFDETAARAGDEAGDNLQASEIYRMKLARARLVVLSACSTASGLITRGEGAMTLARAFIAAGAPTVVASLWKVDSAATADLMIDLHRRRAGGRIDGSAALNKSQQWLRENGFQHPYYWAAFISFGI